MSVLLSERHGRGEVQEKSSHARVGRGGVGGTRKALTGAFARVRKRWREF